MVVVQRLREPHHSSCGRDAHQPSLKARLQEPLYVLAASLLLQLYWILARSLERPRRVSCTLWHRSEDRARQGRRSHRRHRKQPTRATPCRASRNCRRKNCGDRKSLSLKKRCGQLLKSGETSMRAGAETSAKAVFNKRAPPVLVAGRHAASQVAGPPRAAACKGLAGSTAAMCGQESGAGHRSDRPAI